MKTQIPLNNTNLNIVSKGNDKSGNFCIGLRFNNSAMPFAIQTNNNLKNTGNIIKGKDLSKLTEQDLLIIENEVVNYIKKYGSSKQKSSLKTYFNEMNSGDINVYDAPGGGIDWSEDLNDKKMIIENEIKIGDSIEFKHLLSSKTFKGKYKDDYEKGWIMVDCGKDGMVVVKKNDKSIKLLAESKTKLKLSEAIKLIENKTGKKVILEAIGDPGIYYKFTSTGIKIIQVLYKLIKDPSFNINEPFDVDYLNEMRIKISTDNFFKTLLRASMIVETNLD